MMFPVVRVRPHVRCMIKWQVRNNAEHAVQPRIVGEGATNGIMTDEMEQANEETGRDCTQQVQQ
jgi:hypothetical protein